MKKTFTFLMAIFTMLGFCITGVSATDEPVSSSASTCSITINNPESGHLYQAYQIFTGNVSGDTLTDINWGTGVNVKVVESMLGLPEAEPSPDSAAVAAAKISAMSDDNPNTGSLEQFADDLFAGKSTSEAALSTPTASSDTLTSANTYVITGLAPGYYLITDQPAPGQEHPAGSLYSNVLLSVTSDTPITPKTGTAPTIVKHVKQTGGAWAKGAAYSAGEDIPFRITTALPNNYGQYKDYTLILNDTLPKGMTYVNNSMVVKYSTSSSSTEENLPTGSWTVTATPQADSTTILKVDLGDTKSISALQPGTIIYFEYNAQMNEDAVIGPNGNTNSSTLTYSSSVTQRGVTSTTPPSTAKTYLFKLTVRKTDQNNQPLAGAEFSLKPINSTKPATRGIPNPDGSGPANAEAANPDTATVFTFSDLGEGTYELEETKVPTGYKGIQPLRVTITTTYDTDSGAISGYTCKVQSEGNGQLYKVTEDPADSGNFVISVKNNSSTPTTTAHTLPKTGEPLTRQKASSEAKAVSTGQNTHTSFWWICSLIAAGLGLLLILLVIRQGRDRTHHSVH